MDNATFDRLARLLAGGASRRRTLRAIIAAVLTGAAAEDLLAAKKHRNKNDRDKKKDDKKDDDKDRKDHDRGRDNNQGGNADRVSAQGKKSNNKKKRKKKKKNPSGGGNSCAGTPLRPGQTFLGCDFSGRNLRGEDLNSSLFKNVNLTDADLCGANLESTSFTDSEADDANFADVNFDSSSHDKTSYAGANFTNATFRVSTFNKVDFSGANLTGVDFTGATFADTTFSGAIFCRTIQPNGDVDNSDCDQCDNQCGLCEDCDDEECAPPDCCPNPEGPGGICVDTDTDPLNCGGCDVACFTNLSNACVDGECVCGNEPECSGGETCCRGRNGDPTTCVDTDTDPLFCGNCDTACLIPENPCLSIQCIDGDCVEVDAVDGTPCQLEGEFGVCCAAGSSVTCVVGTECCGNAQCDTGEACCEGQCIDVQDDPTNCGGCGETCQPPTEPCLSNQCIGGNCELVFAEDGEPCTQEGASGICCFSIETSLCITDVDDNFDHCGGCLGCDPDKADACVEGVCVCGSGQQCGANQSCCNGECVNTNTDRDNCGACNEICVFPENPCFGSDCVGGECQQFTLPDGTVCVFGEADGVCCGGSCEFGFECCSDAQCGTGQSCCGGLCFNTSSNFDRCGSCTNVCPEGRATACVDSACVCGSSPACAESEFCCPDGCFDLDTSFSRCGSCTNTCPATKADNCTGGECLCGSDPACGLDLTCCSGACTDTDDDVDNCGACGAPCSTTRADGCTAGACTCGSGPICAENETCCNGQCVNVQDDPDNCGACDVTCPTPTETCLVAQCINGGCQDVFALDGEPCSEGSASGICCFSIETSICVVDATCCTDLECPEGDSCCDNTCFQTSSDFDHCGGCDACFANADACVNGECVCGELGFACPEGNLCCSGSCIDTGADRANCGACSNVCETDETCDAGVCTRCIGPICGNTCISPGGCCDITMCPTLTCRATLACEENQCVYELDPDGTQCFGGRGVCEEGNCACGTGDLCPSDQTCCTGECVDTSNNADHCGSCDACNPEVANACVESACVCGSEPACEGSEKCCSSQCIDTTSDRFNCGVCGFECVDGICVDGLCEPCAGVPCGSQCLESPACCTVGDCVAQTCKVRTGCSAEHECQYDNAPAETPCGFGLCDGEGNCISPEE